MMAYKLYLDELRNPKDNSWVVARSFTEFIQIIKEKGIPDLISFDHDLGWDKLRNKPKKSGCDCAKWIVNNKLRLFDFQIHSSNFVGRENIFHLLKTIINNILKILPMGGS